MSLAYVCDGQDCDSTILVEPSLINVLPNGWVEMVVTEGTGAMNNPKKTKHLCPRCNGNYKFRQPGEPKKLGR